MVNPFSQQWPLVQENKKRFDISKLPITINLGGGKKIVLNNKRGNNNGDTISFSKRCRQIQNKDS